MTMRAFIFVTVGALSLICSPSLATPGQSEEEQPTEDHERLLLSPFVRGAVDHSRLHWLRDHQGEFSAGPTGGAFDIVQVEADPAWGGRMQGGIMGTRTNSKGALGLSVLATWAKARRQNFSTEIAGVTYEWEAEPIWWNVGLAGEVQFFSRWIGVSVNVGPAGVFDTPRPIRPSELALNSTHKWGIHSESSVLLHLPAVFGLHPGVAIFGGSFVGFPRGNLTARGLRYGLSVFIEWDGTRK